jgi:hypothetical protein
MQQRLARIADPDLLSAARDATLRCLARTSRVGRAGQASEGDTTTRVPRGDPQSIRSLTPQRSGEFGLLGRRHRFHRVLRAPSRRRDEAGNDVASATVLLPVVLPCGDAPVGAPQGGSGGPAFLAFRADGSCRPFATASRTLEGSSTEAPCSRESRDLPKPALGHRWTPASAGSSRAGLPRPSRSGTSGPTSEREPPRTRSASGGLFFRPGAGRVERPRIAGPPDGWTPASSAIHPPQSTVQVSPEAKSASRSPAPGRPMASFT